MLQLLLSTLLVLSLADPTPPCPAPFPNTAVGESWCSVPLASNPATGVSIAQYGLPAGSTLVTAASPPALWYDTLFYLGGGIASVLEYLALAKVIQNARTVPFVIRPQSPHGTPAGYWLTSMLVSPANYPSAASTLPRPNASTPNVVLEPLGEHAFATLDFNSTSCPPLYEPPYFTAFQRCDAMLAAGLPSGWVLKTDSQWTPSWLIYNKANYNGTWTSRCMAEVVKGGAAAAPAAAIAAPAPAAAAAPAAALLPARALAATAATAVTATATAAPPICALVLEFETFCWGAWAPPHSPNTPLDINGGSDGLHAKDDATGLIVYGTSTDTPFFGLRLAAINTATGAVSTVGSPWILPPPGYSGIGSQFLAVAHSPALGFVVLGYEISQFGPVPTRSSTPGTPLGWTVALAVDPATGSSTALSADLTPALGGYPPLVGGPSAMDAARSVLWVLSAGDGVNPLGPQGCGDSAGGRAGHRVRRARRAAQQHANSSSSLVGAAASGGAAAGGSAPSTEAYFLGLPLAAAPSAAAAAAAPTALAVVGQGQVVTAFEYASAVDAIVALSYSICFRPPPYFGYCSSQVTLYPVNGSAPVLLGGTPAGQYSPMESVGSSQVSADGRFVYFGAVQPSSTFESAALITVDTLTGAIQTANAAPTDDYDVLNLFRC